MGEFSGYDVAVATGSAASPEVENKTNKAENKTDTAESKFKKQSAQEVVQSGETNILNKYRSVTYNFTLAGLKKDYLKNPNSLRESELELVILKSGGKGTQGMSGTGPDPDEIRKSNQETYDKFDAQAKRSAQANVDTANKNLDIIDGFNKNSPGRFDMFIDGVEIESLMTFSEDSNSSLPTKIKFEVIEPYSVNGFIEALYVASLAAGYPNYLSAAFVLKVEFKGYRDDDVLDFNDSEIVPDSERYFPIGLTNIEVDISEKGTRYRVEAVPYNERAFGQPNKVNKPIKMQGDNVKSILTNFIENVYKQALLSWKESDKTGNPDQVDQYEIKFPSWSESDGWVDSPENKIAEAKLVTLYKDNALYKMIDPGSPGSPNAYKANGSKQPTPEQQAKQPEAVKYDATKTVVQFGEGMNIHDVISAVIRDSEYIRNILKDIKKHTDTFGFVDYFMIRIETLNTDVINNVSKKPVQKFIYVVTPYKIHYSKIPNLADNLIDEAEYKKSSKREYNYTYTGLNVDVLNFKLNFNTLFFEAIPATMGNKDIPEATNSSGNNNNVKVSQSSPDNESASKMQVPLPPKKVIPTPTQAYSGNASQPLSDPYSTLARGMHDAVVNSKASMVTGEMDILGDPFYLVTGGIGNYNPKPTGRGTYAGGQANQNYGQLLITINFRNPVDIMPFEAGGTMFFDANRVPFSGVYMVTTVAHTFKDGVFKQRLGVLRMPGQILDYNVAPTDVSKSLSAKPAPYDQVIPDETRAQSPSQRMDATTALSQIGRSIPTPGLPGALSNFTAATGGLGGIQNDLKSLMSQTPGLGNVLSAGSSVIGKALPSDISSNIRLGTSGLTDLAKNNIGNIGTAALYAVAANVITGNLPAKRAIGVLAGAAAGSLISSALKIPNIGSGIGEGASVKVSPLSSLPLDPTALDIQTGANIDPISLAAGSVVDTAKAIGGKALDAVSGIGKDVGAFASGIGDKVKSLAGSAADPAALGASLGINVSALSGLSPNFTSKVLDQAKDLVSKVPSDVNLSQAVSAGLVLDYIPSSKIPNIPATAPYTTAPLPEVDTNYVNQVIARGGLPALENLYGVSNASKLSSNLVPQELIAAAASKLPLGMTTNLKGLAGNLNKIDVGAYKDKLQSAASLVSGATGKSLIPDSLTPGSVAAKFGSTSIGSSPLDKLVNRLGDPNAPPYTGDDPVVRARLGLPPTTNV
jgi:hypothetical protein